MKEEDFQVECTTHKAPYPCWVCKFNQEHGDEIFELEEEIEYEELEP